MINEIEYKIENVVATATFDIEEKMNLVHIAREITDSEYNPERFPGIILRIDKPKATFLVFSTGKMVITGLRKGSDANKATLKALKQIKKAGIKLKLKNIEIQNMVVSGDLHLSVDLNLAALYLDNVMYEPEIFPGLIYRIYDPKAVFLVFSTGKFVCTGVKTEENIDLAIQELVSVFKDPDLIYKPPNKDLEIEEDIVFI